MTRRIYGPLHEARVVAERIEGRMLADVLKRRHVLAPKARLRTHLDGSPANRQADELNEHQRCIQASARWR